MGARAIFFMIPAMRNRTIIRRLVLCGRAAPGPSHTASRAMCSSGIIGIPPRNPSPSLTATNYNLRSFLNRFGWVPLALFRAPPAASDRPLVACVAMSANGNNTTRRNPITMDQYYRRSPDNHGVAFQHRTSHLKRGNVPRGGNIGMLDGHVEWRPFLQMLPRTDDTDCPCYWW